LGKFVFFTFDERRPDKIFIRAEFYVEKQTALDKTLNLLRYKFSRSRLIEDTLFLQCALSLLEQGICLESKISSGILEIA
jgi:hypothetical protein